MRANLTEVLSALPGAAVGSFNVLDLDMATAVADSAEQLQLPAIIGVASRHFEAIRAPLLAPALRGLLEAYQQPLALHLDHAAPNQLPMIQRALDLGFTSIMIDGSHLEFDANAEVTARVVEMCRSYGAGVEGELGAVAGEEGVADTGSDHAEELPYTRADEAARFIAQTGVDALAIAVGTAHGIYTQEPHIHYDTIRNIAAITDAPLVMHGATGVSDAAIQTAVTAGIRKINFFSGLLQSAMAEVRHSAGQQNNDYLAFKQRVGQGWRSLIEEQMRLYAGNR